MNTIRSIGAILLLLTAAVLADADCFVRQRVVVPHHAAVVAQVVTPVAVATFVPVQVPVYSVTYAPDQSAALVAEVQQLRRELQIQTQQLQQLRGPVPQGQPVPQQQPVSQNAPAPEKQASGDPMKTFQAKCASCHDKASAAKGGGFAFLDNGQYGQLDFKKALKIGTHVYTGKMPPGKEKLTDQEVAEVMSWLDGLK